MSDTQMIILAAMGIYFIAMIFIGFCQSRNQDHQGFVIGNRDVGIIPTIGSLAAGFRDGSGIVFWLGVGYTIGYGGLWYFVGTSLGMLFFALCGSRIHQMSYEREYVTVGEMIKESIGRWTEQLSSVVIMLFSLLYMGMQLYVSGNIFAMVLGQPAWVGVILIAIIVSFYLFSGGYSAVVQTDKIQFFLILSLIVLPFGFIDLPVSDVLNFDSFVSLPWSDKAGFGLMGFLFSFAMADNWQRLFSAKNIKTIRVSFPLVGPFLILMTLSLIFVSYSAKMVLPVDMDAGQVAFKIFEQEVFSTGVMAFLGVVLIAITMSTLDTQTYLFSSTVLKNIVPKRYIQNRTDYIRLSRYIMIVSMIIIGIIALTISDVILLIFDSSAFLFCLVPLYFYAAFSKKEGSCFKDIYCCSVLLISSSIYVAMYCYDLFALNMLYMFVPVSVCSILIGGYALVKKG